MFYEKFLDCKKKNLGYEGVISVKNDFLLIFKIMTIVSALNDVWSDAFILQIIIQEELERLTKIL